MAGNRDRSLQAAVELLGGGGVRALTHARVDAAAGLPKGSTSNYFRSRAALFDGVLQWMLDQQLADVAPTVTSESAEELVESLVALFEHLTGPAATTTMARVALIVEAGHDPDLRATLTQGRSTIVGALVPALAQLGAAEPEVAAQALAACFQGMFLHKLGLGAEVDPRPTIDLVVRGALLVG